jgi:hypothetical protein
MFTAGSTKLGAAIRWAERTKGEAPTVVNHVGVVSRRGFIHPGLGSDPAVFVHPMDLVPAHVIESLWKTIEHPWYPDQKPGNEVSIWRYAPITCLQASVAVEVARTFVGAKYGWWKLAAHFVDNKIFGGRNVTRRALRADSRPICSYTAATSMHRAGIRTGHIPARAQSPDSMWDYINESDLWYEVGRGVVQEVR